MSNEPIKLDQEVMDLVTRGDFHLMTDEERADYYVSLSKSLELDPLTRPFEWLQQNVKVRENGKDVWQDKWTLYALKSCSDQLMIKHGISITSFKREIENDIIIVTVEGEDRTGRKGIEIGAIPVMKTNWVGQKGSKKKVQEKRIGEDMANAWMATSTKAKRRLILSMAGLSIPDETEIDSIKEKHEEQVYKIENERGGKATSGKDTSKTDRLLEELSEDIPAVEEEQPKKEETPEEPRETTEDRVVREYLEDVEKAGGVTPAIKSRWKNKLGAAPDDFKQLVHKRIVAELEKQGISVSVNGDKPPADEKPKPEPKKEYDKPKGSPFPDRKNRTEVQKLDPPAQLEKDEDKPPWPDSPPNEEDPLSDLFK